MKKIDRLSVKYHNAEVGILSLTPIKQFKQKKNCYIKIYNSALKWQ